MEKKRSIFPTSITTLDGATRVPTEAELDRMLFQLVIGQLRGKDTAPAPEPAVPTDAELRDQARELGRPVPRAPEGTAERFRDDMLELLSATPEPVATKSLPLPVQIASSEC